MTLNQRFSRRAPEATLRRHPRRDGRPARRTQSADSGERSGHRVDLCPDRARPHPDFRHHARGQLRARPDVHARRLRGLLPVRGGEDQLPRGAGARHRSGGHRRLSLRAPAVPARDARRDTRREHHAAGDGHRHSARERRPARVRREAARRPAACRWRDAHRRRLPAVLAAAGDRAGAAAGGYPASCSFATRAPAAPCARWRRTARRPSCRASMSTASRRSASPSARPWPVQPAGCW